MDCVEFALLFSFCNIVPVRKDFWSCLDALSISISQSEAEMWWSDQSEVFTRRGPHSSMFGIGIVTLTLNFKMKSKRVFSDTEIVFWISARSLETYAVVGGSQCNAMFLYIFSAYFLECLDLCSHIASFVYLNCPS